MHRMLAVARKEARQLLRDRVLLRVIVGMPLAMLLLFGYALNFTLKEVPLAVWDRAQDRISQSLRRALEDEDRFTVVLEAPSREALIQAIDAEQARVGLVIPEGALEAVRAGEVLELEAFVDGADPNFAFQAIANLQEAIQSFNQRVLAARALAGEAVRPPVRFELHTLYNPDNKTPIFMVPGIIGLILTQVTVLLTALAVVREKETRMMEALIATPVRPLEVVLGKVLPYLVLAFADALVILAVGHYLFGVPIRGSLALLLGFTLLFVLGSLGVGVVISTIARTQVQAVFGTVAYFFPSIFLSGFVFPIEGMPPVFQALTYGIPLRYFLDVLRGVMLRGVGLEALGLEAGALLAFGVGMVLLAARRFSKHLT